MTTTTRDGSTCRPRTLILLAKKPSPSIPEDLRRQDIPRIEYVELARAIGAEIVDFHDVERSTHPAVRAAAKRSPYYGLAMIGVLRRREFDHLYATGEDVGMPLAAALHGVRWYGRVTVVIHQCDTPKRRLILRALGDKPWRNVICLSAAQWRILVEEIGIPAYKVHRFDQWIDPSFYSPEQASYSGPGEYVLAVGRESRDYPTLQQAAAQLPEVPFRVIASGWAPHAGFQAAGGIESRSNLTVQSGLSYRELREAYARARMVVAPLNYVTYAAGVTSICEGMAMGKPIVASASPGILDYVRPNASGLLVPVGDSDRMRDAIRALWNDPARCAAMGRHNRRWAEELGTDAYARRVAGLFGVHPPERGAADEATAPGRDRSREGALSA